MKGRDSLPHQSRDTWSEVVINFWDQIEPYVDGTAKEIKKSSRK